MVYFPEDVWRKIMGEVEKLVILDRREFWIRAMYQRLSKKNWTKYMFDFRLRSLLDNHEGPSRFDRCHHCGFVADNLRRCVCNHELSPTNWLMIKNTIANVLTSRRRKALLEGNFHDMVTNKRRRHDIFHLFKPQDTPLDHHDEGPNSRWAHTEGGMSYLALFNTKETPQVENLQASTNS